MKYICANCHTSFIRSRGKRDKNYVLRFCCKECHTEYKRKEYKNKFNDMYGEDYEIITFTNDKVIIRCKKCGINIEKITKRIWQSKLICLKCEEEKKLYKELILNDVKDKRKRINNLIKRLDKYKTYADNHIRKCSGCGKEYIYKKNIKYCSRECSNKIHWYNNKLKRERHIKSNGIIDKDITLKKLYQKEKGICYLCGGKCDFNDFEVVNNVFKVGKTYPSIEHVIPISKGGNHSWNNIKLAHISCNSKKKDN
jgi:5-methylcytosine-specific restriction endonuclease McrA